MVTGHKSGVCRVSSARASVIWCSDAVAGPAAAPAPGTTRSDGHETPGAGHDHDQLPENHKGAHCRRQSETAGQMPCAPRARFERAAYCLGAIRAPAL